VKSLIRYWKLGFFWNPGAGNIITNGHTVLLATDHRHQRHFWVQKKWAQIKKSKHPYFNQDQMKHLDKYAKYFPIFIGYLYIIGFCITNTYLGGNYGITNILELRIQHIVTGFLFNILFFSPPLFIFLTINNIKTQKKLFAKITVGFAVLFISISVFSMIYSFITLNSNLLSWGHWKWILLSSGSGLLVTFFILELDFKKVLNEIFSFVLIAYWLIYGMNTYITDMHPKISQSYAGGKPFPAEIFTSKDGMYLLAHSGFILDEVKNSYQVSIIYESQNYLFVLPSRNKTSKGVLSIAIPKSYITGIFYLFVPNNNKPKSDNHQKENKIKELLQKKKTNQNTH
jgi:hypothetical protein